MTDCSEEEAAEAAAENTARLQLLWVTGAEAFLRVVPPVLPSTPAAARASPARVDAETAGAALRVLDGATAALAACNSGGAGRALFAGGRFVPLVSAVLTALLQVAQQHHDRALRLACLDALARTLALVADPRVLAAVLPGVSTTLAAIATGDYKQGRRITAAALRTWAALVAAVCADTVLAPATTNESTWVATAGAKLGEMAARLFAPGRGPPRTDARDVRLALVEAARTVACACTRLAARGGALVWALDCLVLHADDDDAAVAAVASAAIADLSARDQEAEAEEQEDDLAHAARVLGALRSDGDGDSGGAARTPSLHRVMAERLQRALAELDGVVAYALADAQAVAAVRTVAGYVTLLRARLGAIMPGVVGALVPALVALIEVDSPRITPAAPAASAASATSPVAVAMLQPARPTLLPAVPAVLVDTHSAVLNSISRPRQQQQQQQQQQGQQVVAFAESASVAEGALTAAVAAAAASAEEEDEEDEWGDNGYPPLPLRHFGSEGVCREVRRLCALLGAHDASGLFCSELEACARGLCADGVNAPTAPEVATLLVPAVVGACRAGRRPRTALRACAQLVLDLHAACGGALLGAVVARAVGDLCSCSSGDDALLTLMLQDVLYPVLELLGDGTRAPGGPLLASAARTLARTARAAHTSVPGLVAAHADALTDAVARRLRAPDHRARAPFVFRALLHVAGAAFVPLVRDTLGAALRALRAGSLLAGADMLAVLDEVALAMARVGTTPPSEEDDDDDDRLTAAALREDLAKQLALRRALEAPAAAAMEKKNDPLHGLTGEARIEAIKKYMVDHAQQHSSSSNDKDKDDEEEEEDTLGPRLLSEDEQRVVLLGRVLETAVPYVSSASAAVCVQALGVLAHGIAAMAANGGAARPRDGGSPPLWPLLHRCTRPLLRRVQDAGAPAAVVLRAAEVLARVLHAGRAFLAADVASAALAALTARLRGPLSRNAHATARLLACVARVAGRGGCAVPRGARLGACAACADVLRVAPGAAVDALAAMARADAPAVWAWCNARVARGEDGDDDDEARKALQRVAVVCTEVDDP